MPHIEEIEKKDCHTKRKGKSSNKDCRTRKKRAAKRKPFREKEDSQERELCMEKKIKRREQSVAAFEKDN